MLIPTPITEDGGGLFAWAFENIGKWIMACLNSVGKWVTTSFNSCVEWFSQPHVVAAIFAFCVTFAVIVIIILAVGFGPAGIVAGSLAAAFQGAIYGAFTPAGGLFACLTSMAMLGTLMPPVFIAAAIIATVVAVIVGIVTKANG